MITYKDLFSFLVLASIWSPNYLWGFGFELNKNSIQIGETSVLSISLKDSGRHDKPLIFDELVYQTPQLKVLERNMSQHNGLINITYELTSYTTGTYRVPPIQVKWGPESFSTEALEFTVNTTRMPDDSEIRPDFGKLNPPFPWRKAYLLLLALFVFLLGVWIIRWSVARIPWKSFRHFPWKPQLPNFETDRMWLKKEISRLRARLKKGNTEPELVDEIFYTLKVFLKRKTKTPVPALTSHELEASLPAKLMRKNVKGILSSTDVFKYQRTHKTDAAETAETLLSRIESEFLR